MGTRTQKVKAHLRDNKKIYAAVGLTAVSVAGITTVIMRTESRAKVLRAADCPNGNSTDSFFPVSRASSMFGNATNNVVTTIHTGDRGHSGFITKSLDTGELFATQAAAADAFGVSKSNLSSHLNGKYPDVNGYRFERIGVL